MIFTTYNIEENGQAIRTLAEGQQEAGTHQILWDCKDAARQSVASGIYVYRLVAGAVTESRKMLIIK